MVNRYTLLTMVLEDPDYAGISRSLISSLLSDEELAQLTGYKVFRKGYFTR